VSRVAFPDRRLPTTRPTGVGWSVLALATVLYFAGSNIGSGWLVLLAATLAAGVAVDVAGARRLQQATGLVVCGDGAGSIESPPVVTIRLRTVLREAGTSTVRAPVRRSVGPLDTVDVVLRTVGSLTLAAAVRRSSHEVRCTVVPSVHPAAERLARIVGGHGAQERHRVGRDEVRGLREHAAGDGSRLVHWRASARRGQLLVRDTSGSTGPHVRIDLARDAGWTPPQMVLATTVVTGLATAAEADGGATLVLQGHPVEWTATTPEQLARQHPLDGSPAGPFDPGPDGPRDSRDARTDGPGVVVRPDRDDPTTIVVSTPSDSTTLRSLEEVRGWLAGA
jgi:uncharacterized protein (DUF58 family)